LGKEDNRGSLPKGLPSLNLRTQGKMSVQPDGAVFNVAQKGRTQKLFRFKGAVA